jgi:hypothetical protein
MTSRDEIMLRTPDALLNGQGMVDVIQSCCPSIKNAWQMPATDVDTVLIAIRIASYGHNMDVESTCPHCNESHTYTMDLRSMLEAVRAPDFEQEHAVEAIFIKFRPQAYYGVNKTSKIGFEINKLGQAIDAIEDDETRSKEAVTQMSRLVDLNLEVLTGATEYIALDESPEQRVFDKKYILEFDYNLCFSPYYIELQYLYKDSKTLEQLGFKVKTGEVVWNENKDKLDDEEGSLVIYSSNIVKNELILNNLKGEKKQYIKDCKKQISTGPAILVSRGYGNNYIFSYTKVNQGIKFYGENHINIIYPTTEESKKYIDVILRSFEDKRTQNFIKWYVGNGAISKSEMETILPIFLDEEEVELVFEE